MKRALLLIVVKQPRQAQLFDDMSNYRVIANSRVESTEAPLIWYRQRGEA